MKKKLKDYNFYEMLIYDNTNNIELKRKSKKRESVLALIFSVGKVMVWLNSILKELSIKKQQNQFF